MARNIKLSEFIKILENRPSNPKMSEGKIKQIAFEKYPEDKLWIGSGDSARLYDQNERDRNKFIEGFKEALKYVK